MKAAFLEKPGKLTVQEVPVPPCPEDRLLIRIREVGICGSDLHYYNEGRVGDNVVREPHILGHECSGEVAEVGRLVQGFRPGDRVAIEPGLPCLACPRCLEGRYNLCPYVRFLGAPPNHGAFREYLPHDPRFVYPLPGNVSFTQGALAEPLAVAYNAVRKAGLQPGDTVLIVGAGAIGFSCLEMARAAGAARIIVVEPQENRRAKALALQAALVLDPRTEDVVRRVGEFTSGRGCDCAIEASGSEEGVAQAIQAIRKGGRIALIGLGLAEARIPYGEIMKKEALLAGVYRYANNYRPVLDLLAAGRLDGEAWVSHRFQLSDIRRAMETANDRSVAKLKMLITME